MAIYHCSIKNIGRSAGRSAVACASYRSASKLYDEERFKFFDYTSKDNVVYAQIHLCENAPEEYKDRATLWNAVQKIETADNARLAREFEVAIPNELTLEQATSVVESYAHMLTSQGMCADVCIHWKDGNHHAHIMATTRPIKENGEWGNKERKQIRTIKNKNGEDIRVPVFDQKKLDAWEKANGKFNLAEASDEDIKAVQKMRVRKGKGEERLWERELVESTGWNQKETLTQWREQWSECCNKVLEPENKIDHRSNEKRGIELIPTVHEGYAARQIEARGGLSEICEYNRTIKEINSNRSLLTLLRNQLEIGKSVWNKFEEQVKEWIEQHKKLQKAPEAPKMDLEANKTVTEHAKADYREEIALKAIEAYNDTSKPLLTAEECNALDGYEYKSEEYKWNEEKLKELRDELEPIEDKLYNTSRMADNMRQANSYNSELTQLRNELAEEQGKNIFRRDKRRIEELKDLIDRKEDYQKQFLNDAKESAQKPHFEGKDIAAARRTQKELNLKIEYLEKKQTEIRSGRRQIENCVVNSKWYKHDRERMLDNILDRSR